MHRPKKGWFGFSRCDKCYEYFKELCPLIVGGDYCGSCAKLIFWQCFVEHVDDEVKSGRTWKDYDYTRQKEIYTEILR